MPRLRLPTIILTAAVTLAAAPPLHAIERGDDPNDKVEELAQMAAQLYKQGRYDDAAELYLGAYEIVPVPNLLFNAARCYEKLEKWDAAITAYEQFAADPNVDSSSRKEVMQRIRRIWEIQQQADKPERRSDDSTDARVEPTRSPKLSSHFAQDYFSQGARISLGPASVGRAVFMAEFSDSDHDSFSYLPVHFGLTSQLEMPFKEMANGAFSLIGDLTIGYGSTPLGRGADETSSESPASDYADIFVTTKVQGAFRYAMGRRWHVGALLGPEYTLARLSSTSRDGATANLVFTGMGSSTLRVDAEAGFHPARWIGITTRYGIAPLLTLRTDVSGVDTPSLVGRNTELLIALYLGERVRLLLRAERRNVRGTLSTPPRSLGLDSEATIQDKLLRADASLGVRF